MGAAEEAKLRVVERLKAQRDAVDAGFGKVGETGRFDRGGVGFERDLDFAIKSPMRFGGLDQGGDGGGRH